MTIFQAVWPVLDPSMPAAELFEEARADLRNVAARHRARLAGEPVFQFRDGRNTPGSQGAKNVVVATVRAEAIQARDYGRVDLGAAA